MFRKPIATLKGFLGRPEAPPDPRSCRFIAVIECMLNQNARDTGAACFPAMNFEVLRLCHEHNIGLLQMPCPEIAALGFERKRPPGQSLRAALDSAEGRARCHELAVETADRIDAHRARGDDLVAILGGNPRSPGCAVHATPDGLTDDSGVFLKALQAELRRRGNEVPFRGMRDYDARLLEEDLAWLRETLSSGQR